MATTATVSLRGSTPQAIANAQAKLAARRGGGNWFKSLVSHAAGDVVDIITGLPHLAVFGAKQLEGQAARFDDYTNLPPGSGAAKRLADRRYAELTKAAKLTGSQYAHTYGPRKVGSDMAVSNNKIAYPAISASVINEGMAVVFASGGVAFEVHPATMLAAGRLAGIVEATAATIALSINVVRTGITKAWAAASIANGDLVTPGSVDGALVPFVASPATAGNPMRFFIGRALQNAGAGDRFASSSIPARASDRPGGLTYPQWADEDRANGSDEHEPTGEYLDEDLFDAIIIDDVVSEPVA